MFTISQVMKGKSCLFSDSYSWCDDLLLFEVLGNPIMMLGGCFNRYYLDLWLTHTLLILQQVLTVENSPCFGNTQENPR